MANAIISNSAAAVSGKTLAILSTDQEFTGENEFSDNVILSGTVEDGAVTSKTGISTLSGAGSIVPTVDTQVGWMLRKYRRLTNAEIKDLPITPITLIDAPGDGFRIRIFSVGTFLQAVAAGYGNIDTSYSAIALTPTVASTGYWFSQGPINDDSLTTPLAQLTGWLGGGGHDSAADVFITPYINAIQAAASGDVLWTIGWGTPGPAFAEINNKPVKISIDNDGSMSLNGGDTANYLDIFIYYTIEPIGD